MRLFNAHTPAEQRADTIIHAVGLSAGVITVPAMLVVAMASLPISATLSLVIYGTTLLAMLGVSAAYHLLRAGTWKNAFQRLDHATIFLKIAGTYTPFAWIKIGGLAGYTLLGWVWFGALIGAAGKLFLGCNWKGVDIVLYLALGWAGVAALEHLVASLTPTVLTLLALGGVLYSLGVIFHVWEGLKYQKAIWHAFVLAGSCCHFGAVTTALFA